MPMRAACAMQNCFQNQRLGRKLSCCLQDLPTAGPSSQTSAAERFRSKAKLLFARSVSRWAWSRSCCLRRFSLHGLRVSLAILAPVIGMRARHFRGTVQADLAIFRIGLDFLAVIVRTSAPLAVGMATNGLLRPVGGRLERLLAIATAASDRQRQHSFVCPLSKSL